jgi:hypothetical protein
MKIRPVGAEFHADGQADMTKLIVAFRSFCELVQKRSQFHPAEKCVWRGSYVYVSQRINSVDTLQ